MVSKATDQMRHSSGLGAAGWLANGHDPDKCLAYLCRDSAVACCVGISGGPSSDEVLHPLAKPCAAAIAEAEVWRDEDRITSIYGITGQCASSTHHTLDPCCKP
jgi:hypothetical protein